MNNLGTVYLKAKRWADAEPLLRECLELRRKTKSDAWLKFHTMSQLGACARRPGEICRGRAAATRWLRRISWKMRRPSPLCAKREVAAAAARIISLYESWGKPEAGRLTRTKTAPPAMSTNRSHEATAATLKTWSHCGDAEARRRRSSTRPKRRRRHRNESVQSVSPMIAKPRASHYTDAKRSNQETSHRASPTGLLFPLGKFRKFERVSSSRPEHPKK